MGILNADVANSFAGGPSFSLRNRVYRALWQTSWAVLAGWTPPPLHRWRRLILRLFGARIAVGVRVYGSCRIWSPANLDMARGSVLGPGAYCYNQASIRIDEFATISQRAHLCSGTHDYNNPNFQLLVRPIVIERLAWVAAEAFVGPGVTVTEGSVVGARAVVTRDTEPWGVFSGNPASKIKERRRFNR